MVGRIHAFVVNVSNSVAKRPNVFPSIVHFSWTCLKGIYAWHREWLVSLLLQTRCLQSWCSAYFGWNELFQFRAHSYSCTQSRRVFWGAYPICCRVKAGLLPWLVGSSSLSHIELPVYLTCMLWVFTRKLKNPVKTCADPGLWPGNEPTTCLQWEDSTD